MIAELNGKISSSGSNLSDRLEDKLTGDVFGTLRYLPFQLGMAIILHAVGNDSLSKCVNEFTTSFWGDKIKFWPYHENGELDAFLELDNAVVGIEVKYQSGLSSDDAVDNSLINDEAMMKESCHQLARESRIVKEWATNGRKPYLVFIAKEDVCKSICDNTQKRKLIDQEVELGYVSWEEVLDCLSGIKSKDLFHSQILYDVINLLKRKGFERFKSFAINDEMKININKYYYYEKMNHAFSFDDDKCVNGEQYYEYR